MKQRLRFFLALAMAFLLIGSFNADAAPIGAGVPDAGLTARQTRDGASGIHFMDLDSPVSGSGWITSWSIYAQQSVPGWWNNSDARQVALLFFRDIGSGYEVVGKSPLETIPSGSWDQNYTFTLATAIPVQAGDYLGFYYPFQGSDISQIGQTPGGVIAFDWVATSSGGHNVRWHHPWGLAQPVLNVGDSVADGWFDSGPESEGNMGRIYSINASGTTTLTPIPSGLMLLGSGLAGLAGLRLRFHK